MKGTLKNTSNQHLLILLKKGDERAFSEIYNRYWSNLYAYAYRIYSNKKICEDIVQEIFINLWEKSNTTTISNLEGYLFRAIKYKISTHIRDLKFTSTHREVLETIRIPDLTDETLIYEELENHILQEINKLTPKCKKVFRLSRFENLSNAEISKKLNISIRTVEKHISDALKALKSNIKTHHLIGFVISMFL